MNRAARRAQDQQDTKSSRTKRVAALGSGAILAMSAGGAAVAFTAQTASATVNDVVTNLDDTGAGSLRAAIDDANANGGGTITFAPALTGSITLASDLPEITESVTINGATSGGVSIDGDGFRVFYLNGPDTLTVSNLRLTGGGWAPLTVFGGGTISADQMTIVGNAPSHNRGGGINCGDSETGSTLVVTNSLITGNTAPAGGGGLYTGYCDVTIVNTTIADNVTVNTSDGGGLYVDGGTLRIENSTISGNHADDGAGGVYLDDGVVATISNTTIVNNTVALNGGDDNTAISVGEGASLDLIQSTVSGNSNVGDPIEFYGALYLQDGNVGAGAKQVGAQASHGGAAKSDVRAAAAGPVNLIGTIVSGNGDSTKTNSFDINSGGSAGTVGSQNSLIGDVESSVTVDDLGGTIRSTTPGLAPLANNGGATQTMALQAGSAAIDAGPNPVPTFPLNGNDQRGAGFPRVVAGRVDIGAFEVQAPEPIDIAPKFTG